ncbi:putative disease resistance RPP13-like protein 1 [Vigna unguiculata]|uniref:putative disease resistance RPP13-like protein 1 n=1 Tax=Vigna unguiculata TaxID=3917 RepID=UPI0010162410|nr:putative disease resistance RPP13-like protein 1 [Vigna unguiculata]
MPVIETLGGALFGAVLQVLLDRLDSRQVLDYFRRRKLDEKLLKKLKRKLVSINAVVDNAEKNQFRTAYMKAWLDEVRDVLLDTEDLMDEIHYEFSRYGLEAESQSSSSKVCIFESRIKEVLEDLESLLNQKDDLGLKNASRVGVGLGLSSNVSQKLPSTSLVVENTIYGRDDEKEMILKWMTSDTEKHSQLSILSVVGMGGLGKTTLAQHVYNDSRIEGKFSIKGWVCVSDEFDVLMVTKAIVGVLTKSKDDSVDLEMVQGRLKEKLTGRKFLVVLDDVWNEDRDQWKALQTPLNYGAKGSKILVTTRSNKVASIVQSNKVHELKQLGGDHSWKVFAKHAFQDDNPQINAEVKEIGTKIVEKCRGLPLALETVGCLLRSKSSVAEWKSVLSSEIWDFPEEDSKIIPALLLSYYHLPSHLKRCFSYCAMFPKDHEFDKKNLIQLWMAENFLPRSEQSKSQEEVGEHYFNVLLSRCFFQQSSGGLKSCFVMHDLLNDLAKYISGDICFRFGVDRAKRTLKETRHISFVIDDYGVSCNEYENLYDAKRLRTFLPVTRISYWSWYCETLTLELIFKLKCLHVLSFCGCVNLKEVPETIGDLMHLRFLDLSNTGIQKLPNTMCSLCDLQTLKLNSCVNLKELPCNFHKLTNLRCLELIKNSLTKMPMHIGKLKNLEIFMMSPFNVGKSSELCIHQLGELSLHGDLVIKDLQNTVNPMDALAADLKSKTCLVRLDLNWDLERNLDNFMKEKEILENLQPSKHLKELSISDYGGIQFPHWLSDNSLSNLVSLSLINCKHCLLLPSLEFLTFLRHLTISGHDWIGTIDADFYRNSCSAFASLETLSFADMKEWEEWQCTTGDFPSLQSLSVTNCPKLKGHLPEQLSHLKKLIIEDCKKLVTVAPRTLEICELHLRDCGKLQIDYNPTTLKMLRIGGDNMEASLLERLGHIISHTSLESFTIFSCPNMNIPINHCFDFLEKLHICGGCDSMTNFPLDFFPRLSEIDLSECPNLQMITQRHPLNHLKILRIGKCSRFEYFPNEGLFARQLESFYIIGLENLKSLPKHMSDLLPSLNLLYINDCPEVEVSDGYLPSNLDEMCLFNCSKLIVSLKGPWGTNPSLKSLSIGKVDEDCFPGEGLLPLSITNLEIYDCPNLKKLDYRGLCHLSSLEKLFLYKCPILQCLPEEGLPKSISKLRVEGCPLLKKRCKKQEGEDWEKIAHIKYIIVDRERVNI